MGTDEIPQGDLRLLDHPAARRLLQASIPARLGYVALDGTPRVSPMWFAWNGDAIVLGAAGNSPKVAALRRISAVAVTIDSERAPYEVLMIRGRAEVEIVEGAVAEYADAAVRYLGGDEGARFREHALSTFRGMARITVEPRWAGVIDFRTRFPHAY